VESGPAQSKQPTVISNRASFQVQSLEDIRPLARPDENFMVIMKNGRIYKNTLPA
jgi:hypothetical protein